MNVAQRVAEILRRENVEFLFGYPSNPLIEAAASVGIRPIIVRQERMGIHMADGLSRVSCGQSPAVFCMQYGPGMENSMGAIAQCFGESAPVLLLPTGYPTSTANLPGHFGAVENIGNITKWSDRLIRPEDVGSTMRRAFSQLRNGRPGPVLVEFPTDVLARAAPPPSDRYRPVRANRAGPDPMAVRDASRRLSDAADPVIYAGQGVHRAQAWPQLRQLAERLGAPVTTSLGGKSAFPEDHPLALGSCGRAKPEPVVSFLDRADVIFGVGCSWAPTKYGTPMPEGATLIHSTADPADFNLGRAAQVELLGDASLVLSALLEELGVAPAGHEDRVARVQGRVLEEQRAWRARWRAKLESDETPLSPYRVIDELQRIVDPDHTIITHDAGSPRDQLSPFWISSQPLGYLGWGKTTQLGYGLGLAMGAKLAAPEKLCINVWGDAAIGFTGTDLETAVRAQIPILSILFNNSAMAFHATLMPEATERYRATDIGGDYTAFARSLGCEAHRVTQPDRIRPTLEQAIRATAEGRPTLVEFITKHETTFSCFG